MTTRDGLSEVWTRECNVVARIGAVNTFQFGEDDTTEFEITELIPGQKITWKCIRSDAEWVGTYISLELKEMKNGAAVLLRHSGWKEITEFYRWCNYNWAFFLYSLKCYCEEGTGIPFQDRKF